MRVMSIDFWKWHPEAVHFPGTKVVLRGAHGVTRESWRRLAMLEEQHDVRILRHSGQGYPNAPRHDGLSRDPAVVRGTNGVAQVLSIIQHTGAHTVILLGVDMHGEHWHGGYREIGAPDYARVREDFPLLAKQLAQAEVTVLNASPGSALTCFPRVQLEEVI